MYFSCMSIKYFETNERPGVFVRGIDVHRNSLAEHEDGCEVTRAADWPPMEAGGSLGTMLFFPISRAELHPLHLPGRSRSAVDTMFQYDEPTCCFKCKTLKMKHQIQLSDLLMLEPVLFIQRHVSGAQDTVPSVQGQPRSLSLSCSGGRLAFLQLCRK